MAGASNVRAGGAFIELFADSSKLQKDLRAVEGVLKGFGSKVATLGAGIFAAGAAGLAAFGAAAGMFTTTASAVNDMAARTGVGAEALQKLSFAAKLAGASSEELETGFKSMENVIADAGAGSAEAAAKLRKVGLAASQLTGMSPDKQMEAIADGLSKITDQGARSSAAMDLFGKAGFKLGPMLKDGAAGMAAAGKEAERLGLVMSAADVAAGDQLGDTLDTLMAVVNQVAVSIGAALAPTLTDLATVAIEVVAGIVKFIDTNREMIVIAFQVAAGVAAAGAALVAIGTAISVVGSVIGSIVTIAGALGGVITGIVAVVGAILSPIGLIAVGITAAAGAFLYFSGIGGQVVGELMTVFGQLKEFVGSVIGGISDALMSGNLQLAGKVAMAALMVAWTEGVYQLNTVWLGMQGFFVDTIASCMNAVQGLFIDTVAMLSSLWVNFVTTDFAQFFVGAIQTVADALLGLVDAFEDVSGIEIVDTEAISGQLSSLLSGDDAEGRLLGIESRRAGSQSALSDSARKAQDARELERGGTLGGMRKAADAAKGELASAVAEAAAAKAAANAAALARAGGSVDPNGGKFSGIGNVGALAKNLSSAGSFSAREAGGLAGNGVTKALDRMLAVEQRIAKGIDDLNRGVQSSEGAAFA